VLEYDQDRQTDRHRQTRPNALLAAFAAVINCNVSMDHLV